MSVIFIPVGDHFVAAIDSSDYSLVSEFEWKAKVARHTVYAYASDFDGFPIHLHRLLLRPAQGLLVDHIDGNGLNNIRSNLRLCTRTENNRNRIHRKAGAKSAYKGVFTFKQENKSGPYIRYYGRVSVQGKRHFSPLVETQEEAARGYDALALKHFGAFAALNFPVER